MNILYAIGWLFIRVTATIVFRLKIIGREYIPKQGGFILACNHISLYDPPIVGSCVNRSLIFLAKDGLFKNKISRWLFYQVNARPVKRGSFDRKAVKLMIETVNSGSGIIIFPEGTRSRTDNFLPPKPGIGMIAKQVRCPILPAYIYGANSLWDSFIGKKKLIVKFGRPFPAEWLDNFEQNKEGYQKISASIMAKIADLKLELLQS